MLILILISNFVPPLENYTTRIAIAYSKNNHKKVKRNCQISGTKKKLKKKHNERQKRGRNNKQAMKIVTSILVRGP
jgi:hypothetical protein